MNFTVLFPECKNVCLIKDVGMIPYIMHRNFDYQSIIATYKNESKYSYLREVKGVKLDFLNRKYKSPMIAGCAYLLRKSKQIDILQLYHLTSVRNFIWIILYKILHPKGKIYLKMDLDCELVDSFQYNKKGLLGIVKRKILSYCDLISSEIEEVANRLSIEWNRQVEYIPNGYYQKRNEMISFQEKENIICTVGRIGTYQKATDVLLEGFKKYAQVGNWKLRVIGEMDENFMPWLQKFKTENGELMDKITFTGNIEDRSELENEYAKAKIFCLPSRFESFGIVYLEAMRNGCYIISTDVDSIKGILQGKYGTVVPVDDADGLAETIITVTENSELLEKNCEEVQKYVIEYFDWNVIGEKIFALLK